MTTRPKSFTYTTGVRWEQGVEGVLSAPNKPDVRVSTPPEFKGPEGNWTPENLYIASVETCLLLTFATLARGRKLEFTAYESQAEGLLEPMYGKLAISKITVKPRISIAREEDREKAQAIVHLMEEQCFISNSIESEVVLEPEIVVGEG